jgi:hypothetical protein
MDRRYKFSGVWSQTSLKCLVELTRKGRKSWLGNQELHTSAGTCLASSISALFPARATIVFEFPTENERTSSFLV